MNLTELRKQDRPPLFKIGLDFVAPLVQYSTVPGMLPQGCQITITGEPGVGKTRFALQLLNAIAAANPALATEFHSYESTGSVLADLTEGLGIENIGEYETRRFPVNFKPQTVFVIDSADFWASACYNNDFPTNEMARYLDTASRAGITIIVIHHLTKDQRTLSGVAAFRKISDIVIELKKVTRDQILLSTPSKNRYRGPESSVKLIHTSKGLAPAPPTPTQAMLASITSWFTASPG